MNVTININILSEERQLILKKLSDLFRNNSSYYLAGGTALALLIGHRESYDFDLFRNAPIQFSLKQKILKEFNRDKLQTLVDTADEWSLVFNNEIKVTFLNYFWEPIFPLIHISGILPILSIKDIATTKAYALGRRGNYRDYFDIYAIIKNNHANLNDIIKWSIMKYDTLFSERMFLEQLVYLEDLESHSRLKFLGEEYVPPHELSKFFREEIKKISHP